MRTRTWALVCGGLLGTILVGPVSPGQAEERKPDLKAIASKIADTINKNDAVATAKLYAEDAVLVQSGEPAPIRGRAATEKNYAGFFKAFPDWKVDWSPFMCSGDTIIFEGVARGTFSGPMTTPQGDVAPTGKKIALRFTFFAKISREGLIVEDRTYFDNLDFMQQLGLMK